MQTSEPEYEEMSSFLHSYLERRFGAENLTFESAYNLQDACVRYQHDPRIALFYGIVSGEVGEISMCSDVFRVYFISGFLSVVIL